MRCVKKAAIYFFALIYVSGCTKTYEAKFLIGDNTYSVTYTDNWSTRKIEGQKPEAHPFVEPLEELLLLVNTNKTTPGVIHLYLTRGRCKINSEQELKEGSKNIYEDEEGPTPALLFKKDFAVINNKTSDMWVESGTYRSMIIYQDINDIDCVLFHYNNEVTPPSERQKIENDFYKIVSSLHQIKHKQ